MSVCLGSWLKWITSYNCGVVLIILIAVIAVIIGLDHAQDNFGWVQSNLVEKRCFSSSWGGWLCLAYRRFNWPSEIVVQMIFSRNGISSPKPSDTFALSLSCLFLLGKTFHDMISLTCENIKFYRVSQKKWLTELMKSNIFPHIQRIRSKPGFSKRGMWRKSSDLINSISHFFGTPCPAVHQQGGWWEDGW